MLNDTKIEKNKKVALILSSLLILMFGLSYLSVPIYRIFCKMTGFGGTINEDIEKSSLILENTNNNNLPINKQFIVKFNATSSHSVPWKFAPVQNELIVNSGETSLAFYSVENLANEEIIGISTYNVTPALASLYFNKIQCFCFEQQLLQPKEKVDLPVFFFIDPEIVSDDRLKDIDTIILSYTFFKAK